MLVITSASFGCGGATVPAPRRVQVRTQDYVAVPFAPRLPPVEIVPKRPAHGGDLVWIDGSWEWSGERFRWDFGAWVLQPPGARRARWVVVRRAVDGQLFFAPSSWRDASGNPVEPPKALARATTRQPSTTDGPRPTPQTDQTGAEGVGADGERERERSAAPTDLDE